MFDFITRMSRTRKIVTVIILVAVVLIGSRFNNEDTSEVDEVVKADRGVTLSSVAELSLNTSPLPLLGTVTSRSEANIRAESSGKLVAVYRKLGDYVSAGQVIAEFTEIPKVSKSM